MIDTLTNKDIIDSNLFLHKLESEYYDVIHPEIFNKREQQRLKNDLGKATKLIRSGSKKALEVGCGTGNLTGKLLEIGFEVTALDISKEMIRVLKVGGVLYLDHERTARYWQKRFKMIRYLDLISNSIFNFIYIKSKGIKMRELIPIYMSYEKADYHINEKLYVNHNHIKRVLKKENVEKIYSKSYYLFPTHYFNPVSIFYRIFLSKDMYLLMARK